MGRLGNIAFRGSDLNANPDNACCAMILAGLLAMSYWGMLAAVWWRVEAVALCSISVFCIYLFVMEMTGSQQQKFAAATKILFSDELEKAMDDAFKQAQQHYKPVSSESSAEYQNYTDTRNFGFGLWIRPEAQSMWRAKKPFETSPWRLWMQHSADPETLVEWQGIFDNNNTQINAGRSHTEEQQLFVGGNIHAAWDPPGKQSNWHAFQKENQGHDKKEAATRLGLTKTSNTEGVLLKTAGEYVRFDYSDAVFSNKYWADLKFLAHFVGHVTLKSHRMVSRRKRWIQQEFGMRLKAASVELIQRVIDSPDIWIENPEDGEDGKRACSREPGRPPPYTCWCDTCQKQRLYEDVNSIVKAKQAARNTATESRKPGAPREQNESVIYAAALEKDNKFLSELIESTIKQLEGNRAFKDGLDTSRVTFAFMNKTAELSEKNKKVKRKAEARRDELATIKANDQLDQKSRELQMEEVSKGEYLNCVG